MLNLAKQPQNHLWDVRPYTITSDFETCTKVLVKLRKPYNQDSQNLLENDFLSDAELMMEGTPVYHNVLDKNTGY